MLLESKRVRVWLKQSILGASRNQSNEDEEPSSVSFNPMPALIIFLLGMMMGGHQQKQMVSTMVHKQWGSLLSGAALARGGTYVLTYVRPPTSYLPARPPTELIGAFCLISGGLIFMLSVSGLKSKGERKRANSGRPPISWTSWFGTISMPCLPSTSPSVSAASSWPGKSS